MKINFNFVFMFFPSKVKILQKYITIGMFIALFQSIPKEDITTENSQEDFPRVDILDLALAGPPFTVYNTEHMVLRTLQDLRHRYRIAP